MSHSCSKDTANKEWTCQSKKKGDDVIFQFVEEDIFLSMDYVKHYIAQTFGLGVFTPQHYFITKIMWIMTSCSLVLRCELNSSGMFIGGTKMSQASHPGCFSIFKCENLMWHLGFFFHICQMIAHV